LSAPGPRTLARLGFLMPISERDGADAPQVTNLRLRGSGTPTGVRQGLRLRPSRPPAKERLRTVLNAQDEIEVVGTAGSVKASRAMLEGRPPDVVFLDVEMPGGRGFDLPRRVPAGT